MKQETIDNFDRLSPIYQQTVIDLIDICITNMLLRKI